MRIRIRPVQTSFYDLFAEAANHLVIGSEMVVSLLDPESDKAALASAMHEAENAADDTTHEIIKLVLDEIEKLP